MSRTIAEDILATVAEFRRKGTLESMLCWDAEQLERLAMYAISAKNEMARGSASVPSGSLRDAAPEVQAALNRTEETEG